MGLLWKWGLFSEEDLKPWIALFCHVSHSDNREAAGRVCRSGEAPACIGRENGSTGLPKANCTQQLSRALTFIPEWGVEEQLTGICENDCLDRFSFVHIMIVYYNFMYVMYFPFFFSTWCPGHCEWLVLSWYKCVLCVIPPLPQGIKV